MAYDYTTIVNAEAIDANNMTWSFRVKVVYRGSGFIICSNQTALNGVLGTLWRFGQTGGTPYLFFVYNTGTSNHSLLFKTNSTVDLADNTWHEIEIRGTNLQTTTPTVKLWLDGIVKSTWSYTCDTWSRATSSSVTVLVADNADYSIDELMIWKSALTDAQIATLQAATVDPTAELSPDFHWTFNENDSGTTYANTGAVSGYDGVCTVQTNMADTTGVFGNGFSTPSHDTPIEPIYGVVEYNLATNKVMYDNTSGKVQIATEPTCEALACAPGTMDCVCNGDGEIFETIIPRYVTATISGVTVCPEYEEYGWTAITNGVWNLEGACLSDEEGISYTYQDTDVIITWLPCTLIGGVYKSLFAAYNSIIGILEFQLLGDPCIASASNSYTCVANAYYDGTMEMTWCP
jgi:hypothetical protein